MMTSLLQSFVGNLAVVALFISGWAYARDWAFQSTVRVRRMIFGAILGGGAVASMLMSVHLDPGLLFDLRGSILAISALFGGPVSAFTTTCIAMVYRIAVGGAGVPAGVLAMASASAAGLIFFYLSPNREPRWREVLFTSGAQGGTTALSFLALPQSVMERAVVSVLPTAFTLGLLATTLSGYFLMETRRRAQERDLLVAALAQSPDLTYVKNQHSQFAAVNQAVAQHHGYARPKDLLGKTDGDLENEQRAAVLLAAEREVLGGYEIRDFEELVTDASGTERWFLTTKVPLRNPDGRIMGLSGVTRDVTAEKQFRAELINARQMADAAALESKTSSQLLEATLEAMDQGLMLIRPDEKVPLFNKRAAELLDVPWSVLANGGSHADLVAYQKARGDFDGLSEEVIAEISNPLDQVVNFEAQQRNGTVLETRTTRQADGGIVRTFTDITARKVIERRLQQALYSAEAAQRVAESASQAKTDFLSTMSHEIRTPLNAVIGFTHLALDEPNVPASVARKLKLIQGAGEMLLTVVNDVLDFSRIEAGEVTIDEYPLCLTDMANSIVETLRASAETKGLTLVARLDDNLPDWLLGDEARLRQILLNLINNAIKFTQQGGVVLSLSVVAPSGDLGAMLRFSVQDTGIGIAQDKLAGLFKRFSQLDSSITRRFGGSGLGLAITKQLVELMHGRVGVDSLVGQGSEFWFEIKLKSSNAPEKSLPVIREQTDRPVRILLAEDLALNAEIAATILQRAGHFVEIVNDGAQAVEAVKAGEFDLILMDIQMPGMDGLAATRAIRLLSTGVRAVPIIAMTANVLPAQLEAFTQAGMNDHLAKPFRPEQLIGVVSRWAGQRLSAGSPDELPVVAPIEEGTFTELLVMVGPNRMAQFLQTLIAGLTRLGQLKDDHKALAEQAHMLVSQAGMLGFREISDLSSRLEQACNDESDVGYFMREISSRSEIVSERYVNLRAT